MKYSTSITMQAKEADKICQNSFLIFLQKQVPVFYPALYPIISSGLFYCNSLEGSTCSSNSSITKTYLYNIDPLKPHFYIVKLGFTGVYINFLISAQKHKSVGTR